MYLVHRDDSGADGGFALYHYDPSIAAAVIVALAFIGVTLLHFWQLIRERCWFMIPLAIGGILQVIGYAARAKSGQESPNWTLGPYIIQAIFLLVAPALYAASIYMELGRIIIMVEGESRSLIPLKWLTKIFVIGDVLSFFLQGGGGGYQSSGTLEALDLGAKIIIGGLFVQLLFFGVFIIIAVAFDRSMNTAPTGRSYAVPWKKHLHALYAGSVLIMVRSIFRAIEYLQGNSGFLLKQEIYLYVFDALLMIFVMILFSWYHPAEISAIISQRGNSYGMKLGSVDTMHQRLASDV
ncbi:RTA1 like protein-domain-containing protein [Fusarium flagelliforme]|uniref:Protein rtm1 n=1 Tax=Fusarium flagelliforme TaxID=2675880 RepID=A0A395MLI9_9HYPO|nr:RTA1 like protein-domain-containing protein [Fusarium flagelliforme]KAH7184581.1 RTA1 like protein-domain-containing protein [Fusarium flagelliforme]RFN48647.1 protein rtm1 [Fusarium flagelliforme]